MTIEALRDHQLPGGSVPVRFAPGGGVGSVSYDPTGIALADTPLSRGDSYDVWSYAPSPTPRQLAASKPIYSGADRRRTTSTARWSLASTRGSSANRAVPPTCTT